MSGNGCTIEGALKRTEQWVVAVVPLVPRQGSHRLQFSRDITEETKTITQTIWN